MANIVNPLPAGSTSEAEITKFEEHIGHRLPDDYRHFLIQHNGGRPDPDAFTLVMDDVEQEDIVMCFFPMRDMSLGTVEVEKFEELRSWPVHCAWEDLQNDLENLYEIELDETLLPIGTDGSSNYFCIVLDGARKGNVLFLEHEMAETAFLAESFTAFLDSLRPRERTDYAPDFD
jgi:cell wall assembly regulator SMI1